MIRAFSPAILTDGVGATKRRLLRQAVRHNVRATRRRLRPGDLHPARVLLLWFASCGFIGSLMYLSMPARFTPAVATAATTEAVTSTRPADGDRFASPPHRLARSVLPLPVKRIVVDAGHGGVQAGAISASGVTEKAVTLDVALRLKRLLADSGYEVLLTRETDTTMSLEQRVAFANARRADVFVSVHVNWIPKPEVRSVETYHVGPTDDPATLARAGAENRESGYSLGAYRRLLERIYIDARRDESRALAQSINAELHRSLSAVNPDLENRGVKMAPFAVLVGTEMPAILVEVSCLSNEEDALLLTTDDYRAQIAEALLTGIRAYARQLDAVAKKEG